LISCFRTVIIVIRLKGRKEREMSKFKVGDKVIATNAYGELCFGEVTDVVDKICMISFPGRNTWGAYDEKNLMPMPAEKTLHFASSYKTEWIGTCKSIIFVTHDEDKYPVKRKFIFEVNRRWNIKTGDKLFADTRYGKKLVTAVCEPFEINEHGLNQLSKVLGGKSELKKILSRAVQGYTEQSF